MRRLLMSGICAMAVVFASGCATVGNIVSLMTGRAAVIEQTDVAYASELDVRVWYATAWWQALQEEAVELAARPATPEALRDALRRADEAGSPAILKLTLLAEAYREARDAGAPAEDIEAAGARLAAGIDEANTQIVALGAVMGLDVDPGQGAK